MSTDDLPDDALVQTSDAARVLGVARNTLLRWADSGAVPSTRTLGGHRRFRVGILRAVRDGRLQAVAAEESGGRNASAAADDADEEGNRSPRVDVLTT